VTRSDWIAAAGALLSGTGSIFAVLFALRALRQRMERECEERLRLFRQGIEVGRDRVDS
jgi:hypothetical protein